MHSKLYIFDRFAVIGSANLSKGSESLVEASLLTDQPTTVSSIRVLIGDLFNQGEVVDEKFIQKICKIVVDKSKKKPGRRKKRKLPKSTEPKTWLIGLQPTTEKDSEKEVIEEGKVEAEKMVHDKNSSVSWIRLGGKSNMRMDAKVGDLVVAIWSENPKRNPTAVYPHAPILNRVDDEETGTTVLYVEDYPDAEDNAISWKQFQKLHKQLGISSKLAKFPTRELKRHHSDALHELWKN